MTGLNLIVVYSHDCKSVLLCKRKKDPYKGLSNFVGGHIEEGESGCEAAYRELFEETAIKREDIVLNHLMDFTYHLEGCYIEVWFGVYHGTDDVHGDENELYWSSLDRNFFDMAVFAGEGNMGHILEIVKYHWEQLEK